MGASILHSRRRIPALAVLGLLALLAAALVFSSAPAAYADHEDGHTGTHDAPEVPFEDDDEGDGSGDDFGPFIVRFQSSDTIADRAYTAGAAAKESSALPEAEAETPWGPFTVSVVYSADGLPDGLYLDDSRVIRGTPTAATGGSVEVTYNATGTIVKSNGENGASRTVSLTFRVTVNPAVSFSAETVEFYRTTLITYDLTDQEWLRAGSDGKVLLPAASGGTGTLTYRLMETGTGRPLTEAASGVTFDPATRKLGGTPPSLDFWYVTYSAEDENGSSASFSATVLKRVGGL